jgi:hypothetical protein
VKKLLTLTAAALLGVLAIRRAKASRDEADLWREATAPPDLR